MTGGMAMLDAESFLLGIAAGGGGNTIYVETIEGTLENPWGTVNPDELFSLVDENNATCKLTVADVILTLATPNNSFQFSACAPGFGPYANFDYVATSIPYSRAGILGMYVVFGVNDTDGVVPLTHYFPVTTPTTLTIIHHPVP